MTQVCPMICKTFTNETLLNPQVRHLHVILPRGSKGEESLREEWRVFPERRSSAEIVYYVVLLILCIANIVTKPVKPILALSNVQHLQIRGTLRVVHTYLVLTPFYLYGRDARAVSLRS